MLQRQPKTPKHPLARCTCPGCQQQVAYFAATSVNVIPYLTCPEHCHGRSKGGRFAIRYLSQLNWSREVEFLNGWSGQKAAQLAQLYEDTYAPREQRSKPQGPARAVLDLHPPDAWMRVRCPACGSKERCFLVPTRRKASRRQPGGVPYLRCLRCDGSLWGRKMVARCLDQMDWKGDIELIQGWDEADLWAWVQAWR